MFSQGSAQRTLLSVVVKRLESGGAGGGPIGAEEARNVGVESYFLFAQWSRSSGDSVTL